MNLRTTQLSAFSFWLRTGRHPPVPTDDRIEVKHNPWHDPRNGQFTYADAGRRGGRSTAGDERTFGGGGASGSWGNAARHAKPTAQVSPRQLSLAKPATSAPPVARSAHTAATADTPDRIVMRNGYEYRIDADGRTRGVSGTIDDSITSVRSRTAQARAGGADRRASDDGGHYIAARFNGPSDAFNHFAQDANFNRGGYRALEDQWARDKRAGKTVVVKIVPTYLGASQRPSRISVSFTVNDREESEIFPNERKETHHGK